MEFDALEEELIEKHYKGTLAPAEQKIFAQKMTAPDFAKKVEARASLYKGMDLYRQVYNKKLLEKKSKTFTQIRKRRRQLIRVAAVLIPLILIGAYYIIQGNYTNQSLFQQEYLVYAEDPNQRTGLNTTDASDYINALDAYQEKDFVAAISAFEKVDAANRNDYYHLLLANAYLEEGQASRAISTLEKIQTSKEFSEAPKWYLALAYLANDQEEQSRTLLQDIINDQSTFAPKAQKLLNRLDSFWRKLVMK